MQEIKINEGTIFYWQKSLTALLEEKNITVISVVPRKVLVKDEPRLVVDIKYEYAAKGQRFLNTTSFWCNRELTGDEWDTMEDLGKVVEGELHFGCFMPKNASKKDLDILRGLETPDDFKTGISELSEAGLAQVAKGLAKEWKIDMLTDGVNVLRPSGERIKFEK